MTLNKLAQPPPGAPEGPLEVRPGCWMVGRRNPESLLQCNTYVRTFARRRSPVHVCIDPGSRFDYSVVESNIKQLIGDVRALSAFSVNHQDPDVIGNSTYLCEANPDIRMLVTEDVWRLAQHLSFRPGRIDFANSARSRLAVMGEQHYWKLVPTPFCHFRGAMAFYDPEIRTLFTGDLFGGLNQLARVHLMAEERDWAGIAQFHQIYMPSRDVLRYAIRQIRELNPAVEVIAPQHGYVITGDLVPLFLERMHELLVGHDLLAIELDDSHLTGYGAVIAQLIAVADIAMGYGEVLGRLKSTEFEDDLEQLITIERRGVRLQREGYSAVVKVLNRLGRDTPQEIVNTLRSCVLAGCSERALPIPAIGVGLEESTQEAQ